MKTRVFVGGVAWKTTDEGLAEAFAQFGPVKDAKILTESDGKSRGFGFVTFEDEEGAKAAVEEGNDMELDGRNLRVDWATEKKRDDRGGDRGNKGKSGGKPFQRRA